MSCTVMSKALEEGLNCLVEFCVSPGGRDGNIWYIYTKDPVRRADLFGTVSCKTLEEGA